MRLRRVKFDHSAKYIVLYSIAIALLIFGLKWLQWNFLIKDNAIDIYIGCIALVFTLFGIWVATQVIKPKTHTIYIEKPTMDGHKQFITNQVELKKLNLTDREFQILRLLAKGHSNANIAEHLFLSISTIKTHVSNLYSKMNVKSRFQAIERARRMNIVE